MRPTSLILPLLLLASPASAQTRDAVGTLDELGACTAIRPDTDRLACFDRIAARIATVRQSGELLAYDRKSVERERRTQFGLVDTPGNAGAQEAARATKVQELSSVITGVAQGAGMGRWNLTLANGQVWQTLDEERYGPRPGASIRLITTVTGGFRASIDRTRPVQVKRLR